jgi:hypothetical protein
MNSRSSRVDRPSKERLVREWTLKRHGIGSRRKSDNMLIKNTERRCTTSHNLSYWVIGFLGSSRVRGWGGGGTVHEHCIVSRCCKFFCRSSTTATLLTPNITIAATATTGPVACLFITIVKNGVFISPVGRIQPCIRISTCVCGWQIGMSGMSEWQSLWQSDRGSFGSVLAHGCC